MSNLHFKSVGEGKPVIILHGLFGSSDNWITVARALNANVYLVDLPNHGQSPHVQEFTYSNMVKQVQDFIESHAIHDPIVVGHSMGGKVAMELAVTHGVAGLAVIDISPRFYPVHHQTILRGLRSMNLSEIRTRVDADQQLAKYVLDAGVRQFLLKNLHRTPDGFEWKINLKLIAENIEEVGKALGDGAVYNGPTLFIDGSKSDYINLADHNIIHSFFPEAQIVEVEGAGHWVHAERPNEVVTLLNEFIELI